MGPFPEYCALKTICEIFIELIGCLLSILNIFSGTSESLEGLDSSKIVQYTRFIFLFMKTVQDGEQLLYEVGAMRGQR